MRIIRELEMKMVNFYLRVLTGFLLILAITGGASAQEAIPQPPAPIQTLVDDGAQIRFLGKEHGLDTWLTIKNGQEQYFYVLPDGQAFLMGIMFDNNGKIVTVDQVRKLQEKGDSVLDSLAAPAPTPQQPDSFEFKSPSEQLFFDIENSNWLPFGQPGAPVMYSFIDPQCQHCHAFFDDVRKAGYLENGKAQLRMIPIGFREETQAQAAYLLAAPNPQEKWFQHLDGDEKALPANSEINSQGVKKNLALMQAWKFDATPLIIYRAKDGTVKIVRGRPKDLAALVDDLGGRI
ncbi:MAG TPA: thiol:disulfide interchange protein DsbG [Rhodospirillaceae bacterium]|nr:thiol:disulfide interchange protein DsbG [Rhodospirillaceae bacterium]